MTRRPKDTGPRLTPSGRLSESYGESGVTVRLWERAPGEAVMLQWGKPAAYQSLGYAVRAPSTGGRWAWDAARLAEAREAARKKSAELRLGLLRQEVQPQAITVRQAFALFTSEDAGGMPPSGSARRNYRRAERSFVARFGDRAWNTVTPAEWESVIWREKAKGHHGSAEMHAKNLRTVFKWLHKKRRLRELLDPLEDFDWKALRQGVKPRRERYTEDEMRRLLAVRDEIDPRFALMLVIAAEAGPRSKAIRLWRRSQLDAPLQPAPTGEQAPNGWTLLPALKGQEEPLVFLTAFARRELEKALSGYLRNLERHYQATGTDYPMIPGARLGDKGEKVVELRQGGAYRAMGPSKVKAWLREAEKRARVEHVEHRGWHGLRRLWTDRLEDTAGLDVAAVAGGWADRTMVEKIYRAKQQYGKLGRAREALEGRVMEGESVTPDVHDTRKGE